MRVPVVLLFLVAIAALPAASAQEEPEVVDPAGDAREGDTGSVGQVGRDSACRAAAGQPALVEQCYAAPPPPGAGGDPAPPTMDALAASFTDTPAHLVVRMQLASVEKAWEGAVRADRTGGAIYRVCWTTSDVPCSERVVLAAMPDAQGAPVETAFYETLDGRCNDSGSCRWRVPHELVPGAPGAIEWRVPRYLLPNGTAGSTLADPVLRVTRYLSPTARPAWPSDDGVGYGFAGPTNGTSMFGYTSNHFVTVDGSDPGRPYRLATAPDAPDPGASFEVLADPPGDLVGPQRADLDVLSARLVETPTTLTVSVEVATVDVAPVEHAGYGAFALSDGRYYTWGFSAKDGQRAPYANVCAVPLCHQMAQPAIRNIPLTLVAVPGAPGWLNATFERASLGEPARGVLLDSFDVTLFSYDARSTREEGVPGARVVVASSESTDTLAFAPPWWFREDTLREVVQTGMSVEDATLDVAASPLLEPGQEAQFDLTYLEATGISSDDIRITLGLRDLSRVKVPAGARAIFYGAALQLDDGRMLMAGFHREQDTPVQSGRQTFLCAEDGLVFQSDRRDPMDGVYTAINGAIAASTTLDVSGGSQGGAILLFIPYACFGDIAPGSLNVQRFAAGSYVLLPGGGGIQALDEVAYEGPGVISVQAVQAPRPPWYIAPFGIDGFWDAFGVASSILISSAGILAVQRKRQKLKRYLDKIERILVEHEKDPRAREAALLEVRHQVKDDLLRSRIDQGQYQIVDKRVDEALAKTRVLSIADAFDELPHRLLRRLQDLLVDGRMSRQDYNLFSAMLEQTDLTDEAKARIRRKLGIWVNQDAEDAKGLPQDKAG